MFASGQYGRRRRPESSFPDIVFNMHRHITPYFENIISNYVVDAVSGLRFRGE